MKKRIVTKNRIYTIAIIVICLTLTACGGGSSTAASSDSGGGGSENSGGGFIDHSTAVMALEMLYENGTFKPLTPQERITANLIMFSDVLPE